jgi:hypothetical protein
MDSMITANNWVRELARNISRDANDTAHQAAEDFETDWQWIHENWIYLKNDTKKAVNEIKQWLKDTATVLAQNFVNDVQKIESAIATLKNETIDTWNVMKGWLHELAVNVSIEVNETAKEVADDLAADWQVILENYDIISDDARTKIEQIKEWINTTANSVADTVVDWVHGVAQEVKDAFHKDWQAIKNGFQKLDNITQKNINNAKTWMHELAQNISNQSKVALNKTKEIGNEVIDDVEEDWEIIIGGIILLGEDIQQKWTQLNQWFVDTANESRDQINQFADDVIDTIEGWVDYEADKLVNKTAIFIAESKNAFNRTKRWFKRLLFCPLCDPHAGPLVCVEADNGEDVTFLNRCFAECGDLVILYDRQCDNSKQNYAYVVNNDNLLNSGSS